MLRLQAIQSIFYQKQHSRNTILLPAKKLYNEIVTLKDQYKNNYLKILNDLALSTGPISLRTINFYGENLLDKNVLVSPITLKNNLPDDIDNINKVNYLIKRLPPQKK